LATFWLAFLLSACGHSGHVVTTSQLVNMVRDEPIPDGHVACAVFDADGTLWDFDLSETIVDRTVRDRTASDRGLPAVNALLASFGLPEARDVYEARASIETAWASGRIAANARERGWDEDAIAQRLWPSYNWLYVGFEPSAVAARARVLMAEEAYRAKVFAGVRPLLAALRERSYRVRIISGGVHDFVQAAAADLGFRPEEVRGLALEVRDGVLTDRVVPPVPYQRGKAVLAVEMCGGTPRFVFGDSVASGDSAMLDLAAVPVAVRPQDRHLASAIDRGMLIWERPDVVE
jgi:phosphoserine phosphatase